MTKTKRFLMTLAALFAMTAGAWAQTETLLTTINSSENSDFKSGSKTFDDIATVTLSGTVNNNGDDMGWYIRTGTTVTVSAAEGYTITRIKFYNYGGSAFDEAAPFEAAVTFESGEYRTIVSGTTLYGGGVTKIDVYGYQNASSEPASSEPQTLDLTVVEAGKQWTAVMPAGNVVFQVEYDPWKVTLAETTNGTVTVDAGGVKELCMPESWHNDNTAFTIADMPGFAEITDEEAKALPAPSSEGAAWLFYGLDKEKFKTFIYQDGVRKADEHSSVTGTRMGFYNAHLNSGYKFYYTASSDVTANTDGTYSVVAGKSITLKAVPAEGYELAGWFNVTDSDTTEITDGVDAEAGTLTHTPEGDVTIRAEFREKTYTVTLVDKTYQTNANVTATVGGADATITEGGTIEGVTKGQTVILKANTGYKFRKVEAKEGAAGTAEPVTPALSLTISDVAFYYNDGETWRQAIENHPTQNAGWSISGNAVWYAGRYTVIDGSAVFPSDTINATGAYELHDPSGN